MCSRYELNATPRQIVARFGLAIPPPFLPGPVIRPTDPALVIDGSRQPLLLRWGLAVDWNPKPVINARCEGLDRTAPFRFLLRRRCIVPASAFFEWRKEGRIRHKNRIAVPGDLFALAGLIQGDRFVIATCATCPGMAHIHDRMPVILRPEAEDAWLDADVPFADVAPELQPYAGELIVEEEAPAPRQAPSLFD